MENLAKEGHGATYQLKESDFSRIQGSPYVLINGPYDKYGKIFGKKGNGHYLIRGIGEIKPVLI